MFEPLPLDWAALMEQQSLLPPDAIAMGTVLHSVTRRWQPWVYLGGETIVCLCSHRDQRVAAEIATLFPSIGQAYTAGDTPALDRFVACIQAASFPIPSRSQRTPHSCASFTLMRSQLDLHSTKVPG